MQQFGNIHQQGKIDAFALQHLVSIGTVAMDGRGKPCDATPLLLQFPANHIADMNLRLCHALFLHHGIQNGREPVFIGLEVQQYPLTQ